MYSCREATKINKFYYFFIHNDYLIYLNNA